MLMRGASDQMTVDNRMSLTVIGILLCISQTMSWFALNRHHKEGPFI